MVTQLWNSSILVLKIPSWVKSLASIYYLWPRSTITILHLCPSCSSLIRPHRQLSFNQVAVLELGSFINDVTQNLIFYNRPSHNRKAFYYYGPCSCIEIVISGKQSYRKDTFLFSKRKANHFNIGTLDLWIQYQFELLTFWLNIKILKIISQHVKKFLVRYFVENDAYIKNK